MRSRFALLGLLFCFAFVGTVEATAEVPFHIGIMTGTVSQAEDDLRGAELLIQKYGNATEGGMITHITYPDNFMSEMETTIGQLLGLADDPQMKVIVVNAAVPGTTEAFRRIREKRSDILLFAGSVHEDPEVITAAADLSITKDNISRGYTIPLAAKRMGAKTFVHISFPRHMSYELLGRRRVIMEAACNDLGLQFVFETAPDPTSDVGWPVRSSSSWRRCLRGWKSTARTRRSSAQTTHTRSLCSSASPSWAGILWRRTAPRR